MLDLKYYLLILFQLSGRFNPHILELELSRCCFEEVKTVREDVEMVKPLMQYSILRLDLLSHMVQQQAHRAATGAVRSGTGQSHSAEVQQSCEASRNTSQLAEIGGGGPLWKSASECGSCHSCQIDKRQVDLYLP